MKKWNIMLLQGEDVGRHLGCYGDEYARTPHLDRLASEGARYTHAISHSPVCAPSRGGMLCGRYPWSIGNHSMRSKLCEKPEGFTNELVNAGYHVSWPTKQDFNFEPAEGWCTDLEPWHDRPPPSEPFFFYENFNLTHESRMFAEVPAWHGSEFPCPSELEHDPSGAPIPPYLPDIPELREQLRKYYDAFSAIDFQIGERLRWLEENGLSDQTIVMFLSDHGRGLPREKRWLYDAGVHLPLIIRWPGNIPPGSVSDELVGWIDIAPTLLSLVGITPPDYMQGQVFLGDHAAPERRYAFAGSDRMDTSFDKVRSARDKRYAYIRNDAPGLPYAKYQWYMEQQPIMPVMRRMNAKEELSGNETLFFQHEKSVEELYDTSTDPHQLHNLAHKPEMQATLLRMRNALDVHLDEVGDLGETDERDLVANEVVHPLLDQLFEQVPAEKPPPELLLDPDPQPSTLKEAEPWLRGIWKESG